jgi:hypothetical protein
MARMRGTRVQIAIAVALAATGMAVAAATATQTVHISSQVTISRDLETAFHGRVLSPKPACRSDRTVKILRRVSGPDPVMGHDRTDARGRWDLEISGFAGAGMAHFYAKVRRRAEGTAGTIFVCDPDISKTV